MAELRVAVAPAEKLGALNAHLELCCEGEYIDHYNILSVAFQRGFMGLQDYLTIAELRFFSLTGRLQFALGLSGP